MPPRLLLLLGLGAAAVVLWFQRGRVRESIIETYEEAETQPAGFFTPIIETVERIMTGMTRGERNNNPGNIERREGTTWQGMAADQSGDSRFIVFDSPEYGIRALGKLLKNYQAQGINTIEAMISRYAPGSENDTRAYIEHVAQITGFAPDTPLDMNDSAQLHMLVQAIITHENGRNVYAENTINEGISLIG